MSARAASARKPAFYRPTIFMMDLWATVPYYTAYLSQALLAAGADLTIGSISYYLDPQCFTRRGLRLQPGALDLIGRLQLPQRPRRVLKFAEALLNMAALTLRFLFSPPAVVHIQYLPLLRWRLPFETWFLAFCRWRGSAIVLTVHDLLPHDTAGQYKQTFAKLYRSVDGIICHSAHVKLRLHDEFGIEPEKVSVIPHGPFFYDLPDPSPSPAGRADLHEGQPVNFLWQGIVFPYKGVDVLLDAWKHVEAAAPSARLLVAGTGAPDLLRDLQEQAQRLALAHVRFDFRFVSAEELVAAYRTADVVVYPYSAITTSGALATGLALGKTIVATDLPVFRELLQPEVNALLVPPHDARALSAALIDLTETPEQRQRLAAAVRAMSFGEESWRVIATETIAAYEHALHPDPRPSSTENRSLSSAPTRES